MFYFIIDIVMLIIFNGNYVVICILIICKFREVRNDIKVRFLLFRMSEGC